MALAFAPLVIVLYMVSAYVHLTFKLFRHCPVVNKTAAGKQKLGPCPEILSLPLPGHGLPVGALGLQGSPCPRTFIDCRKAPPIRYMHNNTVPASSSGSATDLLFRNSLRQSLDCHCAIPGLPPPLVDCSRSSNSYLLCTKFEVTELDRRYCVDCSHPS